MPEKTPERPPRDNLIRALAQKPVLRAAERAEDDAAPVGMPTMIGHFAVFDTWTEINSFWEGEFLERIAPGAFKKTFRENRDGMRVLFNHGQDFWVGDKPLGPILDLREDKEGAYYEVPLLDTTYNRDIRPGLEAGLYGASFRFRVMKEELVQKPKTSEWNPRGLPERTIKEAQVMEFGPVTFPAYPAASAGLRESAVRSLTDAYVLGRMVRDPDKVREALEEALTARKAAPELAPEDKTEPTEPVVIPEPPTVTEPEEPKIAPVPEAAPEALPEAGAGDEPHSDDRSRGPAAIPAATAAPIKTESPVTLPKENRQMPAIMTIEERRNRDDAIQARFQEIHQEFGANALPEDVRTEWEELIAERNANRASIADFERRTQQLSLMADDTTRHEPVGLAAQERANRGSSHRGVPSNPFAIEEYRALATSLEELRTGYRDGAMQVLERTSLAHPDADEAKAKTRIERLLARDTADGAFAQRLIATGSPAYQRAFGKSLKGSPLTADEQRALSLGSDPDGGFAVPFQLDPTIILTSNGVVNPLRAVARVETIIGKEWQGVTSEGITVTRAAEADEASDDSPTLAQPTVATNRVQGFIPFSVELGQDWGSLQSEMAVMLSDAKDTEEATSFVTGNGVGLNPGGIVGSLAAGSVVLTVANDAFSVADVYKLEEALPPRFRARARFLANRAIYNKVRQFDTSGGASLWVRLIDGLGNELVGYPAHEASVMESAITDTKQILLFGDFKHFLIVDRLGMSIELIPHLFGANGRPTGQRGIYAIWRNNSVILVDNAFRLLEID